MFALFHDSQRETDYIDPEHGPRGALPARELIPSVAPDGRLEQDRELGDVALVQEVVRPIASGVRRTSGRAAREPDSGGSKRSLPR